MEWCPPAHGKRACPLVVLEAAIPSPDPDLEATVAVQAAERWPRREQGSWPAAWPLGVTFQRTNPFVQSVSKPHRGQGSRTAKYPILIYGDEAGFAELTPEQQEWMMKALVVRP